jgi:hypothetical protein
LTHSVEGGLAGGLPKAATRYPYMPESLIDCDGVEEGAPLVVEEIGHPVPCETNRAMRAPHASVSMRDTHVLAFISAFDFPKRRR